MKRSLRIAMALLVAAVLGATACRTIPRAASSFDCQSEAAPTAKSSASAVVVVDTEAHSLALCEGGSAVETFSVRLGKNGTGKSREGDGKTPLGRYGLSDPRASSDFGTFVPVGYPTAEQRRAGYTGGAIGIHGPHRGVRWAGAFVNLFDTTDGCIGIATDADMGRIAEWIRTHGVHEIVLK